MKYEVRMNTGDTESWEFDPSTDTPQIEERGSCGFDSHRAHHFDVYVKNVRMASLFDVNLKK
jgi:hypothetical protein